MVDPYRFWDVANLTGMSHPEKVYWQSIERIKAKDICDEIALSRYGVGNPANRDAIHRNIRTYITQANEFYSAAQLLESKTSPLLYYYSFLNLAKAVLEFRSPNYHLKKSSTRHGISRPMNQGPIAFASEYLKVENDGVWLDLLTQIAPSVEPAAVGRTLHVKELFGQAPEVWLEFIQAFQEDPRLAVMSGHSYAPGPANDRIVISVEIQSGTPTLSPAKFQSVQSFFTQRGFVQGSSVGQNATFTRQILQQSVGPVVSESIFRSEFGPLNIMITLQQGNLVHYIPIGPLAERDIPQIINMYGLFYWLSRLVRYTPQDLDGLSDSRYWHLIDGFISESSTLLLVLFEWELYQRQSRYMSMW